MYFGIYGPLLGATILMVVVYPLVFGMGKGGGVSDYLLALPRLLPLSIWIVPFALVVGILPGAMTGLVYAWLTGRPTVARLPPLAKVVCMSLVGGGACMLFCLCLGAPARDLFSGAVL